MCRTPVVAFPYDHPVWQQQWAAAKVPGGLPADGWALAWARQATEGRDLVAIFRLAMLLGLAPMLEQLLPPPPGVRARPSVAGRRGAVVNPALERVRSLFSADLEAVELLFTSLLVQVQRGLAEASAAWAPGARARSQSFRAAFLLGFTGRIGERLDEVRRLAYADAAESFLPVLHSRDARIEQFVTETLRVTTSSPVRGGYDSTGYVRGRMPLCRALNNRANCSRSRRPAGLPAVGVPGPERPHQHGQHHRAGELDRIEPFHRQHRGSLDYGEHG